MKDIADETIALPSLHPDSHRLLLLRPRLPTTPLLRQRTLVPLDPAPEEPNRVTDVLSDALCAAFGALLMAELARLIKSVGLEVLAASVLLLSEDQLTCSSAGPCGVVHCCAGLIRCCTELG